MSTKGKHWRSGPRLFEKFTRPRPVHSGLTQKQITVLSMLAFGLTIGEIAAAERVSNKAIEERKALIYQKLRLSCMADIVKTAIGFNLIKL